MVSLEEAAAEHESTLAQLLSAQALRARVIRSLRAENAALHARIRELEEG
jgi:hypothetical protein